MFGWGSLDDDDSSSGSSGLSSVADAFYINDDNGDGRGRFSKVLQ